MKNRPSEEKEWKQDLGHNRKCTSELLSIEKSGLEILFEVVMAKNKQTNNPF